jgi:hypothetical protein
MIETDTESKEELVIFDEEDIALRSKQIIKQMKEVARAKYRDLIKGGVPEKYIVFTVYNANRDTNLGVWLKTISEVDLALDTLPWSISFNLAPGTMLYDIKAEDCRTSEPLRTRIQKGEDAIESMAALEKHIRSLE